MEVDAHFENDYFDAFFYTKEVKSNDPKHKDLCLVCMLDETEDGNLWDKWALKCGHVGHSRCLRKWCGVKNHVNCPYCGDIPEIKENRYCAKCNKFGHSDLFDQCKKYAREMKKYEPLNSR